MSDTAKDETFLDVEAYANNYRETLLTLEDNVRLFVTMIKNDNVSGDKGEVIAQAMLSLRHIEDARMRLGKCIQYSGNGISVYDKK